jgi:hypothetical protein
MRIVCFNHDSEERFPLQEMVDNACRAEGDLACIRIEPSPRAWDPFWEAIAPGSGTRVVVCHASPCKTESDRAITAEQLLLESEAVTASGLIVLFVSSSMLTERRKRVVFPGGERYILNVVNTDGARLTAKHGHHAVDRWRHVLRLLLQPDKIKRYIERAEDLASDEREFLRGIFENTEDNCDVAALAILCQGYLATCGGADGAPKAGISDLDLVAESLERMGWRSLERPIREHVIMRMTKASGADAVSDPTWWAAAFEGRRPRLSHEVTCCSVLPTSSALHDLVNAIWDGDRVRTARIPVGVVARAFLEMCPACTSET